jgi:hypothetical protein
LKKDNRIGWFLRFLVSLWKKQDPLPFRHKPDLIVATSYTTGKDSLVKCTWAVLKRAIEIALQHDGPTLAMSHCSFSFPEAELVEKRLRTQLIEQEQRRLSRPIFGSVIHAEPMINTVTEAFSVRRALEGRCITPKTILVVTGEGHSRSASLIWSKVFPHSRVYLDLVDFALETQPDHPVVDQRSPWKWFIMNILRQCALRVLPLRALAKVQHGNGNLLVQIFRNLRQE